jgi:hypothetical protein
VGGGDGFGGTPCWHKMCSYANILGRPAGSCEAIVFEIP